MGLTLLSLVTCLFVTYAHGLDFSFSKDNSTCIIMKMNAAFNLSNSKEFLKLTDPVVDPSKSYCSNGSVATLALKWKDKNDTMTITFTKGVLEKVEMLFTYVFIPLEHFRNSSTTLVGMISPAYELSMSNMSYKCQTPQNFELSMTMYKLEISVADVQIQAFDVENSNFSDSEECSEDSFTTDSPASETTIHQNQTTGPRPTSPPELKYKYPNNDSACIILESAIQLNINYMNKNKNPQTAKVNIAKNSNYKVKGQCAVKDTGSAYIMLSWIYKHSNFSLRMDFFAADKKAKLNKMTLHADLSQEDFPDLPEKKKNVNSSSSEELFETSALTYYKCSSPEEVKLDNTSTVVFDMIQVQAFGVKKEFTGTGTECSQDMSTENPTTSQTHSTENTTVTTTSKHSTATSAPQTTATSAPMSTTAPLHPTNNYSVTEDNITCVFLIAKIDITIPYTLKNGTNASVVIGVPQEFQTDGKCKENQTTNPLTNELNVHFFNHSWQLTFIFQADNSSSQLGDMQFKTYSVKSITLLYEMNSALFPDQDNETTSHFASTNITSPLFQSNVNGSYKCNVESEVPLNRSIKLEITHLQYKAFNKDNSTAFGGDLLECAGDNSDNNNKTNSVVPIAVGAALAGLVVIVLIAYLIGRRRNRKGYESV